jgi:copper resistance protein B
MAAMEHAMPAAEATESAVTHTRDPHGYSSGFTLSDGPYAIAEQRQLVLADEHIFKSLLANRFEYDVKNKVGIYDVQAWVGSSFNRLVLKAEGDLEGGSIGESQTELFWGHAIAAFWELQLGARFDYSKEGESRQWLAAGVQGLAPYWFEMDITAYVGDHGHTALSLEIEYELLFTQRLILQPRAEFNLYGKNDAANGIGKGLSNAALGMRLRYEFSRQLAPYIGVEWVNSFGQTADYAEAANESKSETRYLVGLRFWF